MNAALEALARFVVGRPRAIAGFVVVLLAACVPFLGGVLPRLEGGGLEDAEAESWRVRARIEALGQGDADVIAIYSVAHGTVDDPEVVGAIIGAVDRAEKDPAVRSAKDDLVHGARFLSATDRSATAVILTLRGNDEARLSALPRIHALLAPGVDGVDVAFTGFQEVTAETTRIAAHDLVRGELIALPLTLLILLWVFGSFASAALPVALGAMATSLALALLGALTFVTDVSLFAANIITLLAIGLAVDASLFLVTRFREELGNPLCSVDDAVVKTVRTAGRAVLLSGGTVALSMLGLLLFPQMLLRSLGEAGVVTVIATSALVVTFVPAVLAIVGRRIDAGRLPFTPRVRTEADLALDPYHRLARFVMRRPVPVIVVVTALLLAAGAPFLRFIPSALDYRAVPKDDALRTATEQLNRVIQPNLMTPHEVFAVFDAPDTGDALSPANLERAYEVHRALTAAPGVSRVISVFSVDPSITPARTKEVLIARAGRFDDEEKRALGVLTRGNVMRFLALPTGTYSEQAALDTVRNLRKLPAPAGVHLEVGGASAGLVDLIDRIRERAPPVLGLVLFVTFVVLAIAFRSVVVPLKALVLTALSLTASFGALVFIFQDGRFVDLLHYEPTGVSDAPQPIVLFCLVFGLSMDYEVILLSRIQEEFRAGFGIDDAVARGLARTGRLITSAAGLFIIVVAAFTTSQILTVKELGFGMAVAVAVDATVVRAILVPATLKLFGRFNWWPSDLARSGRRTIR